MANLSRYLENVLLNVTLRATAYTAPATVYIALFTTDPTDLNTGTEVVGNAYTRMSAAFNAPTTGSTANTADVLFPVASASWGTISHIGIYDAATVGNLLYFGPLGTAKAIAATDQFKISAGGCVITAS